MKGFEREDCFQSFLANHIIDYINMRATFKYHMDAPGYMLLEFDRYVCEREIKKTDQFTSSFFLNWLEEEALEATPGTLHGKVSILKSFFDYLVRIAFVKHNPIYELPVIKLSEYIPYVFSRKQMENIFTVVRNQVHQSQKYSYARWCHYTIIYTIYACGLRISECLNLKEEDINWQERTLFIREAKFGKSRVIPFHRELEAVLRQYRSIRDEKLTPPIQWLFSNNKCGRYHRKSISCRFDNIVKKTGITDKREVRGPIIYGGPSIHSLRHNAEFLIMPSKEYTTL